MLQNARVTTFIVSELLKETNRGERLKLHPTSSLKLKLTKPFESICSFNKTELYEQNCSKLVI